MDTTQLTKTSEMLNEDLYWSIIDQSLTTTNGQEDQEQFLISEIKKLTPQEIIGFRLRTDQLLYDTYTSEMWCAGSIMNGGCSDDGFQYFRNWVISRGKEAFYQAKQNPDTLVSQVRDDFEYDFESFWYVALEAFNQKTGKELYDYIDNENFKTKESDYPTIEFNWDDEDPDSLTAICPELYDKFMN
ncbi:MAG: polymerase [Chitinophagaceae bacterium]|nr:polymerase [Chitinophagaceae bacterium]